MEGGPTPAPWLQGRLPHVTVYVATWRSHSRRQPGSILQGPSKEPGRAVRPRVPGGTGEPRLTGRGPPIPAGAGGFIQSAM